MKNNKGITMISLVITIIVLLILTSVTIYNGLAQLGIKRVNNLYADIDSISTKVAEYYLKNETLPVFDNKYVNNKSELEALFRNNGATTNIANVNDGEDYYVIDLSKLDNLTLNYGDEYKDWTSTSSSDKIQNIYIINSVTHQLYFPHGVRSGDEYYFARFPDENEISPIELEEINSDWTMNITNISGTNIGEDSISIVADVTLSGLTENYDLNSLEYAWSETNDESKVENIEFTKFNVNNTSEENKTATLASKALNNTAEYYYLWVKAVDINGKISYKYLTNVASPLTGKLPRNYQRVEFIQSGGKNGGKQYIDTGYIFNNNSGYYIDFVPLEKTTATQAPGYINAGGAGGGDYIYTRIGISVYVANGKTGTGELQFFDYKLDPKITKDVRTKMSIINGVLTYNDGSTVLLNKFTKDKTANSLTIFASHMDRGNVEYDRFSSMKLYNFKIYESDEVIRNFIPCIKDPDTSSAKPGLYELVEGKFYVNQGTGKDFITGDPVD